MAYISIMIMAVAVTCLLLRNWKKLMSMRRCHVAIGNLPSVNKKTYPFVGHLYLFPKDPLMFLARQRQLFLDTATCIKAKVAVLHLGYFPLPCVIHPDAAETILRSSIQINKPSSYNTSLKWIGDGLLISKGQKWHQRRRLVTPAFHFNILEQYIEVMNEKALILVRKLAEKKDNKGFDLAHVVQLCTLDIICETAMGTTINAQEDENHEYVRTLERVSEINALKIANLLLNIDFIFNLTKYSTELEGCVKILHKFSAGIIRKRMKEVDPDQPSLKNTSNKFMPFMDILMQTQTEDGNYLSASAIQEEVDTFMAAGHDTNAATINWICYMLGRYPDVQRRVQNEVDALFDGDNDHRITIDELWKLPYLEMVIKETLRLYPTVTLIGRSIVEDCIVDGYELPKDTEIYINIMVIHRNPEVWSDAAKFDPERFTKDRSVGRHPLAFIPFSAGPRNCIGQRFAMQEQKVVMSHIIRNFDIVSHTKEEDIRMHMGLATRMENCNSKLTMRKHEL